MTVKSLYTLTHTFHTCVQARLAAAKAFRVLCVRCSARLSSPAVLSGLVGLAHTALNSQQVAAQGELRLDHRILHELHEACSSRQNQVFLSWKSKSCA